jgi:hypothetical protein
MPRGEPLDPDFAAAMRLLDAIDLPYAEIWRKLGPIAATLGRPRPSYSCVRRYLVEERRRKLERIAFLNALLDDAFRGMGPRAIYRVLG